MTEDHDVAGSSPARGTTFIISDIWDQGGTGLEEDKVFINIVTSRLTVAETLTKIKCLQIKYPDHEIFLDGDAHAIIGRRRK